MIFSKSSWYEIFAENIPSYDGKMSQRSKGSVSNSLVYDALRCARLKVGLYCLCHRLKMHNDTTDKYPYLLLPLELCRVWIH
jgi:hypothetical protein